VATGIARFALRAIARKTNARQQKSLTSRREKSAVSVLIFTTADRPPPTRGRNIAMRKLVLLVAVSALVATVTSAQAQNCINCQTGNPNWRGQPLVNSAQEQRDRWSGGAQRNCVQNGVCPR
jgi:hypothetical protein